MVKRSPRGRRGATSTGCLVSLLFLVGALYYGVNIGELFFRYYRLLDEMQTQAQLAPSLDDGTIRRRIQAAAQDIGLPPPSFSGRPAGSTSLAFSPCSRSCCSPGNSPARRSSAWASRP